MKRKLSNRGEALAEVAAARALPDRQASLKTSFMTQADRRAGSAVWFAQPTRILSPRKRKQRRPNEDVTISL